MFVLSSIERTSAMHHDTAKPKAHRDVARACAANRVAALIPCHRVLYANGDTAEYRWGRKRKAALLADEAAANAPNAA